MKIRFKAVARPQLFCFIFYLVFSFVILFLSTGAFVFDLKKIGFSIISPCQIYVKKAVSAVTGTLTAIKDIAKVRKERDELLEKLANYENMQRTNAEMRKENAILREQLGFVQKIAKKNIPAQIVARDPTNIYSALVIDKGLKDGVRRNMPVLAVCDGSIGLVGKIVEVSQFSSMIVSLCDMQFNVSARIQKTRSLGLASGEGYNEGKMLMRYVAKSDEKDLQYGDLVVTSGESENFDRNILIGKITAVESKDYLDSLEIEVEPIVNFAKLETVVVVSSESEAESK